MFNLKRIISFMLIIAVLFCCFTSCKSKSPLVGKWADEIGFSMEFTFDGLLVINNGGHIINGSYEDKGDKISVTIRAEETGIASTLDFPYEIKENTLTITDPTNGKSTSMAKK
jgi:hypothetical protein